MSESNSTKRDLHRPLFCPICGVRLMLPTDGTMPEDYVLPVHAHGPFGNMCEDYFITIKFSLMNCRKCGHPVSRHPSGLCRPCYVARDEEMP